MFRKVFASAIALGALLAMPAAAVTINFDDLPSGAVVTTQYAGVSFSSAPGYQVLTTAQSFGSSAPNFICSGTSQLTCSDPVYVDFAAAVNGLRFLAVGDNDSGIVGNAAVFAGATLLGSVGIIGNANAYDTPILVDLSAFAGITRLAITTTDAAGLGYDDFSFVAAGASAVPEPESWALLMLGFGVIGVTLRRRTAHALAS